jgi:pimeloyl-ACP methyl ester carboxylesterase
MSLIEVGKGPPLLLIPGVQGRWEYLRPAIEALATSFRTLTFPLCGERGCDAPLDPTLGIDNDARQIAAVIDRAGIDRAVICGISFGGLPAIRFAAVHPERTAALVLASVPGPHWHLGPRHRVYTRAPWLFGPLFLAESPWRLRGEVRSALPHIGRRWRFVRRQLGILLRAPLSPTRMAERAALISSAHLLDDCAKIVTPTLVVTGEPGLDRVVRVEATLAYMQLINGARHATLDRTGHLGSITRPEAFAALVREFVERSCGAGPFDVRPELVEGRAQGKLQVCDGDRRAQAPQHSSDAA